MTSHPPIWKMAKAVKFSWLNIFFGLIGHRKHVCRWYGGWWVGVLYGWPTKGAKCAKSRSWWRWLKKMKKIKTINSVARIGPNKCISAKNSRILGYMDGKWPKWSPIGCCSVMGLNHSTSMAYNFWTVWRRKMRLGSFWRSFKKLLFIHVFFLIWSKQTFENTVSSHF